MTHNPDIDETQGLLKDPEDPLIHSESSIDLASQIELNKISEKPVFPLKKKEFFATVLILLRAGIPLSLTFIASFLKGLTCLAFIGKYASPAELAGASLATSLGNIFLMGIIFSINQGFGVITSHLFGAGRYKDIGALYQRNICVMGAVCLPLMLLMSFSNYILIALGTDPEVSEATALYFRYIIPSLLGMCICDCSKSFLLAQNNYFFAGALQTILLIIHVLWCILFVTVYDMPFAGPAFARSLTDVCCAIFLVLYINYNKKLKESVIPWSRECLHSWWSHFKQTMTIGFNIYVSQILFEFSVLIVIYLNDKYVMGAHSIAIILSSTFFMMPLGNSLVMQAKIGNAVGEGLKYKAQKFMAAGLFINIFICIFYMTIMFAFNHWIVDQFTNEPETRDVLISFLYINCISYPADTHKDHIAGILRTTGRENAVFKILIICYLAIGVNAQWILSLVVGLGYPGVWIGTGVCLYVAAFILIAKLIPTDWDKEIKKIKERMNARKASPKEEEEKEKEENTEKVRLVE